MEYKHELSTTNINTIIDTVSCSANTILIPFWSVIAERSAIAGKKKRLRLRDHAKELIYELSSKNISITVLCNNVTETIMVASKLKILQFISSFVSKVKDMTFETFRELCPVIPEVKLTKNDTMFNISRLQYE